MSPERCAFCDETDDLVRDYVEPLRHNYRESQATMLLCRLHAARRAEPI